MKITQVILKDLPEILRVEQTGFNQAEAGTETQYRQRIDKLAETFLVARSDGQVTGFVVGPAVKEQFVEDWMYQDTPTNLVTGGNQIIFTIAVDPKFQGQHVGTQLLQAIESKAQTSQRKSIALTSLEKNLPFYLKNDFVNQGVAESTHAGETWFNLVKKLY